MIVLDVGEKGCRQGGVGELVYAQRTKQGVLSHARNQVCPATKQSGLRASQQLISAVGHDVDGGMQAIENVRFAVDSESP